MVSRGTLTWRAHKYAVGSCRWRKDTNINYASCDDMWTIFLDIPPKKSTINHVVALTYNQKNTFRICFVGLLVCQKDCTKTTGQGSMKFGLRSGLGPIKFSCGCGLRGGCRNFFSNLLLHCGIGQFLILVGMALDEINQAYSEGLRDYRFDADPNKNPDQADLNMLYSILD